MFTADDVFHRTFIDRPDWYQDAACRGHENPDLWFAETRKTKGRDEKTVEAKSYCRRCPVRQDCLDYAETHHELLGVWGGLCAEERKERRRIRGRVA